MENTKDTTQEVKKTSVKLTLSKKNLVVMATLLVTTALMVLSYSFKNEAIIATVNGKPITRVALWKNLEQQSGSQTLDAMITEELILQEGKKQNIVINKEEIDSEIKNIENSVVSQGLTLEQALSSQGMSKEELEKQIVLQLTLEQLVSEESSVTESDIDTTLLQALEAGEEDSPELREQIKAQLEQAKMTQAIQSYLANIRQESKIDILNNNFSGTSLE